VELTTASDPADQVVQDRVRASFERQGLMSLLGAQLSHIGSGQVHVTLPGRLEVSQQHGYFHAGATSAIADTAGGYAALTQFEDGDEVLTVEYKINLLAPAAGERLEAVGAVVKSGRTLTVCRLEVYAHKAGQTAHVATGQQTLIRVSRQPAG